MKIANEDHLRAYSWSLQVDDKYEYSCESKDIQVHGWISKDPPIGVWQITPSYEFRSGGPVKQFLTSHVGPTSLNVNNSPLKSKTLEEAI